MKKSVCNGCWNSCILLPEEQDSEMSRLKRRFLRDEEQTKTYFIKRHTRLEKMREVNYWSTVDFLMFVNVLLINYCSWKNLVICDISHSKSVFHLLCPYYVIRIGHFLKISHSKPILTQMKQGSRIRKKVDLQYYLVYNTNS